MNCTITESYINKVNENYIVTLIIFWSDDYGLSVIKQNIDPFGLYWICSRTSSLTGFHHALPLLSSHNTRRMIPHSLNLPTHVNLSYILKVLFLYRYLYQKHPCWIICKVSILTICYLAFMVWSCQHEFETLSFSSTLGSRKRNIDKRFHTNMPQIQKYITEMLQFSESRLD